MKKDKLTVFLCTPLFPPSVGGAATYTSILVEKLLEKMDFCRFIILTTKVRGVKTLSVNDRTIILRFLLTPYYGSSYSKKVLITLINNIIALIIGFGVLILFKISVCHVMANSYFHFIARLMYLLKVIVIIDMRSQYSAKLNIPGYIYISCSENITEIAKESLPNGKPLVYIPVQINREDLDSLNIDKIKDLGDRYSPFLLYVGEIRESKGVGLLIESFKIFNKKNNNKYKLLLIGPNHCKDNCKDEENIYILNGKTVQEVYHYMAAAELLILPSKSEGMPRVCLEALYLKKKVLCPSCVPEFRRYIPRFIVESDCSVWLAEKIEAVLSCPDYPNYPLAQHIDEKVYDVFKSLYCIKMNKTDPEK